MILHKLDLTCPKIAIRIFFMRSSPHTYFPFLSDTIYFLLSQTFASIHTSNGQILTLSTLGIIFSRRHIEIFSLIFPRKQDLTFYVNCLQWRQFAWTVKSCFLGKIRKKYHQFVICWISPESSKGLFSFCFRHFCFRLSEIFARIHTSMD